MSNYVDIAVLASIIAGLTFLSQSFAGLNIGLMSLDTAQLQVLIDVPGKDEQGLQAARCARKILPLRQQGNLLLCTILLGNVMVNTGIAMLMASYAGFLLGWLLTTAIILLFGEIVPQSVCTRHGLKLGAAGAPIIQAAMLLLFPLAKPYAMILDRVFPQRENLLHRSQLRSLVEYQHYCGHSTLDVHQAEMLVGALGFAQRTVGEIMLPLSEAFKLRVDDALDKDLMTKVVRSGFSRFPVMDTSNEHVEGILHCKDFINHQHRPVRAVNLNSLDRGKVLEDSHELRQARTVGELLRHIRIAGEEPRVYVCGKQTKLLTLLCEFKRCRHLAIVADIDDPGEAVLDSRIGLPVRHIGIVTLQDVLQLIMQADGFQEGTARRSRLMDSRALEALTLQPGNSLLGEAEVATIANFLTQTQSAFSPSRISRENLLRLLAEVSAERPPDGKVLYRRGETANYATLIVQGMVRVLSGDDGFESTTGPWTLLGARALEPEVDSEHAAHSKKCGGDGSENDSGSTDFVPDFSASVLANAKCVSLRIERAQYLKACVGRKETAVNAATTECSETQQASQIESKSAQGARIEEHAI